jgi:hypothetical protein
VFFVALVVLGVAGMASLGRGWLVARRGLLLVIAGHSSTGTVTGGTDAYANPRGVLVAKHIEAGADDTVTLGG